MRTASELVRATRPFAREVRWYSWWHVWSTLAILIGFLTLSALDIPWWCRLPSSVVAGLTLVRVFVIYHDHQHGTILRRSPLATVVLSFFGLLLLAPPSIWRRSHQHHHKNNGRIAGTGIGTFPLMTTHAFARASRWKQFEYALNRHPLTMLCGYATVFMLNMCLIPFLMRPREHADAAAALALHVGLIVFFAFYQPLLMVWLLFVPLGVAMALGSYLFYAQHNFPGATVQTSGKRDHLAAALGGSSYIPMNALLRWFTGNIGYHHVHHLNSSIPFYRLPEAMAGIIELQTPPITTLSLRQIYRCLRLKLWDADQLRLVGFRGD